VDGIFITFEGGEGAGKTTVIEKVASKIVADGFDVLVTREPGGIHIAEEIRRVILHPEHTEMEKRTEALLYAAARRQHLVEKIIPALHAGKIILCDRFIDSSLAYQGYARGIGIEEVLQINRFAIDEWMPSLTLYFQARPTVGLQRIHRNSAREKNRLDMETIEFHEKVYEGYEAVLRMFPERIKKVDAEQPIQLVTDEAYKYITQLL